MMMASPSITFAATSGPTRVRRVSGTSILHVLLLKFSIEGIVVVYEPRPGVHRKSPRTGTLPQSTGKFRRLDHTENSICEPRRILRFHQQPGLAVSHDLGNAAHPCRDNGPRLECGLQRGQCELLLS